MGECYNLWEILCIGRERFTIHSLYITIHETIMVECYNLWEIFVLDVGDLSVESGNTAVAGTNESSAN